MKYRQRFILILFFSLFLSHFGLAKVLEKKDQTAKKPALVYVIEDESSGFEAQKKTNKKSQVQINSEIKAIEENNIIVYLLKLPKDQNEISAQIKKITNKLKQDNTIDLQRLGLVVESLASVYINEIEKNFEQPMKVIVFRDSNLVFNKETFKNSTTRYLYLLTKKDFDEKKIESFKRQLAKFHISYQLIDLNPKPTLQHAQTPNRFIASAVPNPKEELILFLKRFLTLTEAVKY